MATETIDQAAVELVLSQVAGATVAQIEVERVEAARQGEGSNR